VEVQSSVRFEEATHRNWLYRGVAVLGFLIAIVLSFAFPYHLREPDSWAYYYAIKNFSEGRLVVSDPLHRQQVREAEKQGGKLIQYVRLENGNWALEKAPGYVFFVVPFEKLGVPRVANVVLGAGALLVTYLLLRRLRDEKTASLGSLLLLFTPVSLIMFQRSYMAMFGATAFLVMGGGLYLFYTLREERTSLGILFLAGLFLSWSIAARYTNLTVVAVFVLHFLGTRLARIWRGQWRNVIKEALSLGSGALLPLAGLLAYHTYVFGSPFDFGYKHSHFPIRFAFQYLGQAGPGGQSIPLHIVRGNLNNMPMPLFLGFPLLALAIPGLAFILGQKLLHRSANPWPELSRSILLLLFGWVLAVFGLYLLYEWTSPPPMGQRHFIVVDRFYLPGLFPLVVISSLLLVRWPRKLALSLLVLLLGMGLLLYVQTTLGGLDPRPIRHLGPGPVHLTQPSQFHALPSQLIERARRGVRFSPTNPGNLDRRLHVLQAWIRELKRQGYPVEHVLPAPKMRRIEDLRRRGNLQRASILVDQAYKALEQMVRK